LITVNGTLNIATGTAIRINQINEDMLVSVGDEFPMFVYTKARTGTLNPIISAGFRGTFSLVDAPNPNPNSGGTISLRIDTISNAPPANLTWTGANVNPFTGFAEWDLNITPNFTESGSPATFFQKDNVLFDDSASTGTVNIRRP